MQQLIRVVAENYLANYKRQRDYTYIEREVENKLDGKGRSKSTESKTYEVMELYGEQVQRLIEKDDKPLDGKDAAKEEEKNRKDHRTSARTNRKNERSEAAGERRKEREKNRKFVREVADAYNFTPGGNGTLEWARSLGD